MEPPPGNAHFPTREKQFRVTIRSGRMQLAGKFLKARSHRNLPAQTAQAMAQQVFQARQGHLAEDWHTSKLSVGGQLPVLASQIIKETGSFGKMRCRLSQGGFSRRKALTDGSQRFVTQEISGQRGIGIALVGDPVQSFGSGIAFDFGTGNIKHRPQHTQVAKSAFGRHSGSAGHPAATQQIVQHGFGLITAVLREQKTTRWTFGKSSIARAAGGCLETQT